MRRTVPSSSFTWAAKSMRNIEILSRVTLGCSWRRISTLTTSFLSKADNTVLAMRSSSIKNLNTQSYIGLATEYIIIVWFYLYVAKLVFFPNSYKTFA